MIKNEEIISPPLSLTQLGWSDELAAHLDPKDSKRRIGRIVEAFRKSYLVHLGDRIVHAASRGALHHKAAGREELPAVGDWVVVDGAESARARLWRTLPRRTCLIRQAPGTKTAPQVIAANLDTIFIVSALNLDFNIARLERYLTLVRESGAQPVFVLTKADLCEDTAPYLEQLERCAPMVPVLAVNAHDPACLDPLEALTQPGQTLALIGSSGVGKSTLVNLLHGAQIQTIGAVRESDGKGRHTTTTRQLIVAPSGRLIVDTPGMRELHLWQAELGLRESFDEIEQLAQGCKYRDCRHDQEDGCAVKVAIEQGLLSEDRVWRWQKLMLELDTQRQNQRQLKQQEGS